MSEFLKVVHPKLSILHNETYVSLYVVTIISVYNVYWILYTMVYIVFLFEISKVTMRSRVYERCPIMFYIPSVLTTLIFVKLFIGKKRRKTDKS